MNQIENIFEQPIEEFFKISEEPIKVYVKVNENKEIMEVDSSVFIKDITGWIEIDDITSGKIRDKYVYAQTQYFDKPLINDDGSYNYKYIDNKIIEL